jgi:hypothetical protein
MTKMKKEEVELILFKVMADGQDVIHMKIYKNGTTCRNGAGGLPVLGIGAMSFIHDSKYFDPLIEKVPQEVLDQPINYEEETPNGSLEYVIAFYGVSTNGITGERANWSKSTGIRVKLDQQSNFNHPIMGLLDGLTMDAAELTNDWYFDVIILSKWGVKSTTLPEETIITQPKTEKGIDEDYEHYVNQMIQSARQWNLKDFIVDKVYEKDGITFKAKITHNKQSFSLNFEPFGIEGMIFAEMKSEEKPSKKKSWWKF